MPRPLCAAAVFLMLASQSLAQGTSPPAAPEAGAPHAPAPLQPGDAFGEDVTLPERTIVFVKSYGTWDKAFEAITDAFKTLNRQLDGRGIKPAGSAMTIYTRTDDKGFDFQAALPVAEAPANLPSDGIAAGPAPAGKALKFTHRGSFDALNTTYEAITNHLDEKRLDARDIFIEEYAGNAMKNAEENLVVIIFVPIK